MVLNDRTPFDSDDNSSFSDDDGRWELFESEYETVNIGFTPGVRQGGGENLLGQPGQETDESNEITTENADYGEKEDDKVSEIQKSSTNQDRSEEKEPLADSFSRSDGGNSIEEFYVGNVALKPSKSNPIVFENMNIGKSFDDEDNQQTKKEIATPGQSVPSPVSIESNGISKEDTQEPDVPLSSAPLDAAEPFFRRAWNNVGSTFREIDDRHHHAHQKNCNIFKAISHGWRKTVGSAFQELDEQHHIRRKTRNSFKTIDRSVRKFWSAATDETEKFRSEFQKHRDQANSQARETFDNIRYAASSAKDSACRANEEYRITEKVATVAAVGGAALMAISGRRAAVGALAIAGASLAAGEAMKSSSAKSNSTFTRDYGLREGVHID